ncbi:hypothetical protein [Thermococcus zilligii]|nr:hypothetical protein [Thermococcus zilligii]
MRKTLARTITLKGAKGLIGMSDETARSPLPPQPAFLPAPRHST